MIVFQNEGEIDIRGATTFGLSQKESKTAIGRFGTGLKYAISVILREQGDIQISSGVDVYSFSLVADEFRGSEKQFVHMSKNGGDPQPLGFTVDLGRDWEPWQSFRELYSNSKDEQGSVAHAEKAPKLGLAGQTTIVVDLRAFDAIFYSLEEYFIGDGEQPLWENDEIAVYSGRSKHIFYQGIRVLETKKTCAFRYNIKTFLCLTEDRTAKYLFEVETRLARNLPFCDVEAVCSGVLGMEAEFERDIDYVEDFVGTPSTTFCGAVVSEKTVPLRASQLVQMTLPDDPALVSVSSPSTPGAKELANATNLARNMGLSHEGITFVLGHGLPISGNYNIREERVFFASDIVEDQREMNIAVIMAIAEKASNNPKRFLVEHILETANVKDMINE